MIRATQSALLIYFYRQVRDVNPRILQPLVKEVKDHLLACEDYKTVHGIASSSLVWPGFVAAIEAHDENDFLDLSACLRGCGERSGLRNFDRAAAIAADMRYERLAMAQSCTPNWRDVLQDKHIPLVCS
jgi:arginine metabolism regulation protein II